MKRFFLFLLASTCCFADYRDDIGYTKLKAEYGAQLPSAAAVRLLQVEYTRNGAWAPGPSGEVSSKQFNYVIGRSVVPAAGAYSDHAIQVAAYLAGTTSSMTPEIAGWTASEAVAFGYPGNLNAGRSILPIAATWDIENHSWGGNDALWSPQILAREDYRIERDQVIAVAAVDDTATMSQMIANGYNSIAVGVSNGNDPHTGTSMDTVGRDKPEIVAPASYTSYAAPIVASACAILVAETNRTAALAPARSPMVIKALLLAGADKSPFAAWSHSPTHPLDSAFGAGQINIYATYKTLLAGQHGASALAGVPLQGWDLAATSTKQRRLYFFTVPAGQRCTFSAALAWFRHEQPDANLANWASKLANLDLQLFNASAFTPGQLLDVSTSTIDNVEHIYHSLPAGSYALEVTANTEAETYGLAWNGSLADDTGAPAATQPPPRVNKFTASNAWSGPSTPTTVSWDGTGARAVITDANGAKITEPPSGAIIIDLISANSAADWYLTEYAVDGTPSAQAHMILHGRLDPTQLAGSPTPTPTPTAAPTPVPTAPPTPTPTPSPDQLCQAIAAQIGVSYDPTTHQFGAASPAQIKQLYQLLTAQGL